MAVLDFKPSIVTTDQVRAENCLAVIKNVLANHNCQILPQIVIVGNQIVQSGYIVAANTAVPPDLKGQ